MERSKRGAGSSVQRSVLKEWENMLRGEDVLDDTEMFVILLDSNYTFVICFLVKICPLCPGWVFHILYARTHAGKK